jgi:hypothetical protein
LPDNNLGVAFPLADHYRHFDMDTAFSLIIPCLIACGAGFVLVGLLRLRKGLAVQKWPQVKAKIRSFDLRFSSGGAPEAGGSWVPKIEYEYEVDGTMYLGKRLSYGKTNSIFKQGVIEYRDMYPVGEYVTVIYNPRKPEDSVLEIGGEGYGACIAGVGVGLIAGGAFLW